MKRNQAQVIVVSLTGTLAAISIGYLGVQFFGKNAMYMIATGMFGLGTGGSIGQILVEKRQQRVVQTQSKQR
jgi:F0F1-type ATP synthase assembly protein I